MLVKPEDSGKITPQHAAFADLFFDEYQAEWRRIFLEEFGYVWRSKNILKDT